LVQWKIQVIRYLEKYVGVAEAESFLNLRSNAGSGRDLKHYKSSYRNHLKYIETMVDKIEKDPKTKLEKNEHKLSFGNVKFIYR
jgi:hypothetical protein